MANRPRSQTLSHPTKQGRSLSFNISLVFVIQLIGYPITYLLNILLARWLGPHGFGEYIFIKNWVILLGTLGTVGIFGSALKFVSLYHSHAQWREIRGFVRFALLTSIAATLLLQAIASFLILYYPPVGLAIAIILPGLTTSLFFALHSVLIGLLLAFGYVGNALIPGDIARPILIIILSAFAIFGLGLQETTGAILALFFATGAVCFYQLLIAYRYIQKQGKLSRSLSYVDLRRWFSFSLESLFFRSAILLRLELSIILIGYLASGIDVGLFTVAERATYVIIFLSTAVRQIFEPLILPLYQDGRINELELIHARITRWIVWVTIAMSAGVILFSDFLLGLFGTGYLAARPALMILIIGQIINAVTGQAGSLLRFTKYEVLVRYISLVSIILAIFTLLLFVPRWGIEGAALSFTLVSIIQNIAFYLAMRYYLHIRLTWRTFLPFGQVR